MSVIGDAVCVSFYFFSRCLLLWYFVTQALHRRNTIRRNGTTQPILLNRLFVFILLLQFTFFSWSREWVVFGDCSILGHSLIYKFVKNRMCYCGFFSFFLSFLFLFLFCGGVYPITLQDRCDTLVLSTTASVILAKSTPSILEYCFLTSSLVYLSFFYFSVDHVESFGWTCGIYVLSFRFISPYSPMAAWIFL